MTLIRDIRRPILSQAYELGSLTCAALHITLDPARAVVLVTKPLKPKRILLFLLLAKRCVEETAPAKVFL